MEKQYCVYILTNKNNAVLYTGVTNDIYRRLYEHREKLVSGFTGSYNVNKLVFYEFFNSPQEAIAAEKKIKVWARAKKVKLIESKNPKWEELETA